MLGGYVRVSSVAQSLDVQLEALRSVVCEKVFSEKFSDTSTNGRNELAVRHHFGQCDGHSLPGPGFAPPSEPPIDRVPIALLGRNIAPGRATAK